MLIRCLDLIRIDFNGFHVVAIVLFLR
jgi:hypothetical protein